MRYVHDQKVWLLAPPRDERYEVVVAGGPEAPNPTRLALVQCAIASLVDLKSKAEAYLDAYVSRATFAPSDSWFFEGIESGRVQAESEEQCSLYFTLESDHYGEWSVTLQQSQGRFYPVGFGRKQV